MRPGLNPRVEVEEIAMCLSAHVPMRRRAVAATPDGRGPEDLALDRWRRGRDHGAGRSVPAQLFRAGQRRAVERAALARTPGLTGAQARLVAGRPCAGQRLRSRTCRGLPVHGQRTRCNARTRKGPRKTVAGKKILRK